MTQESVATSTMPDALEIVGVAEMITKCWRNFNHQRDLSDPKYDFEIFEDENDAESRKMKWRILELLMSLED